MTLWERLQQLSASSRRIGRYGRGIGRDVSAAINVLAQIFQ